jgi:hypothetical protein
MEVWGEWLDRSGRHAEAERVYEEIAERYDANTYPLGTFLMRKAERTRNPSLHAEAGELLRAVFPSGPEPLAIHALDPTPRDGIAFATFGPRAEVAGLKATDIIVGVDQWRVRNNRQYVAATRFQFGDVMTLTVWRDRRYQQIRARVPERWFGTRFQDYLAGSSSR